VTKDEIKSRIPILQAWLDQEAIQFMGRLASEEFWRDYKGDYGMPDIFSETMQWRVKPSEPPKPMEWWIDFCPEKSDTIWHYEPDPGSVRGRLVHVREVLSDPTTP
jgi:hypothetical protein